MKNSGNKKDDEDGRKKKLNAQGESLYRLDESSRRYNAEKLGTPEKKDEQMKPRI